MEYEEKSPMPYALSRRAAIPLHPTQRVIPFHQNSDTYRLRVRARQCRAPTNERICIILKVKRYESLSPTSDEKTAYLSEISGFFCW